MYISDNFKLSEFVSPATLAKWGDRAIWFVDQRIIQLAEYYKIFFLEYFNRIDPEVVNVYIIVNSTKKGTKNRGYRTPAEYQSGEFKKTPLSESFHRQSKAFDCDIVLVYKDGSTKEVDYKQIHAIIQEYATLFYEAGLRAVESVDFAPTWLHSDIRNTGPGMKGKILVVKP